MSARLLPYIPRLTVDWARRPGVADIDVPHCQTLDATMVFGDVSGFTKMSERLARHGKVGAEEIADAINACFEELLGVANRAGGSLLKFGGDALLLLFDGDGHAVRAAQAAIGMRARLRDVGRLSTSAGKVVLRISIGVHTGSFNVFLVGGSHRELVVSGPAVTATVDAEGTATAGEIVMSAATASALPPGCRGPARGSGFLLRNPTAPLSEVPIQILEMQDHEVSRYVPTAIREHLLGGGADPVHRTATVSFLHFDGTDEIVNGEGPEHCATLLDATVRRVQQIAESYEVTFLGTDVDHDGGKIILVSGAPRRVGDDEERILTALREVVDADPPLPLRIGVNTGPVFAGDVGPAYRRTFTVMGDTVNLAARLMAKASPGQVLATQEVLDRSQRSFVTDPLPPFMVKGKRRPVTAFAVGDATRARVDRRTVLPLAGVDEELSAFEEGLSALKRGEGRVVEIIGDHGSGKTRLVEELRRRASELPCLNVTCESYEATSPYAPFWILFRQLIGVDADCERDLVVRRLSDTVSRDAPELSPVLPLLATPLDLDLPDTLETARLEPEFRRQAVEQAATEFLLKVLPLPALLVMEDAHHMDEASQGLVRRIIDLVDTRAILVCLTRRPTGGGFLADAAAHLRTLQLSPWSVDTAVDALTRLTNEFPLLPHEIRSLAERSTGNPLFLEELWRARVAGSAMEALPDSIDTAVTAQIDRLPPRARQTLRCASVLGTTFRPRDLADLLQPDADVPDVLDSNPGGLADVVGGLEDFLVADGSGIVHFRSEIVRECAYEELPYRRRRELHGRAGEAIAASLGESADQEAEVLSLHFFHAQSYPRAWHYACVAGRRAREKYANVDAATHFESALSAGRRIADLPGTELASVWESLGDARERAGDYEGAASAYHKARRLFGEDPVAAAELCLKEAWIPERVGRYSEAVRWIRRGLRAVAGVAGVEAGRRRAQLTVWYAMVRQAQGHHREAVTWCEKAIAEARDSGDRDAEAHALYTLDWAWMSLGRSDRCADSLHALEIYTELGDLGGQAVVLNNLGVLSYFRGDWDDAISYYERGREARLASGNDIDAAFGTCNVAEILANQGHYEEADRRFREGLRIFRAARYRYGIGYTLLLWGQLAGRMGSFDEAYERLSAARMEFEASGLMSEMRLVDARTAECMTCEGRSAEAIAIVERLVATGSAGLSAEMALLQRVRGNALMDLGDLVGASGALDVSLQSAKDLDASYEIALTLVAQQRLARLSANDPLGYELEIRSKVILDQLGVVKATDTASVPSDSRVPDAGRHGRVRRAHSTAGGLVG
ncbi:MAG: adenylate/guanylate cyclase domain-containing protein [Acidimicrobiales bacterium]